MSRSILFDEPYEIGSETELNCPITNDVLIYLGEKEGTLRFAPKNILSYIEFNVSVLDYLSNHSKIDNLRINYQKFYDHISKRVYNINRDLSKELYNVSKQLESLFKVNGRNVAFKLNEDNTWEKLVYVNYVGYVNANTSEDEIKELIRLDDEKYKALQQKQMQNGEAVSCRVFAKTISQDLVSIKPL